VVQNPAVAQNGSIMSHMTIKYTLLCLPIAVVAVLSVWLNIPTYLLGAALGACLLVGNTSHVHNPALKTRMDNIRAQRHLDSSRRSSLGGATADHERSRNGQSCRLFAPGAADMMRSVASCSLVPTIMACSCACHMSHANCIARCAFRRSAQPSLSSLNEYFLSCLCHL
jgi:hypothetical protein